MKIENIHKLLYNHWKAVRTTMGADQHVAKRHMHGDIMRNLTCISRIAVSLQLNRHIY